MRLFPRLRNAMIEFRLAVNRNEREELVMDALSATDEERTALVERDRQLLAERDRLRAKII